MVFIHESIKSKRRIKEINGDSNKLNQEDNILSTLRSVQNNADYLIDKILNKEHYEAEYYLRAIESNINSIRLELIKEVKSN